MVRLTYPEQLFNKIVRADYLPVDRTTYSERLSNLVDHLLIPDPNIRPKICLLYTSPSPRDGLLSRMPSSA